MREVPIREIDKIEYYTDGRLSARQKLTIQINEQWCREGLCFGWVTVLDLGVVV